MTDAGLMGKASIDWDHLDADDHENLEKLTAPYWAIDEARGKGQGEIGRPARASSKRSSSSRCAGPARACVCPKRPSLKRPCSAPGQSDVRSLEAFLVCGAIRYQIKPRRSPRSG